jgi:hypothetical protein
MWVGDCASLNRAAACSSAEVSKVSEVHSQNEDSRDHVLSNYFGANEPCLPSTRSSDENCKPSIAVDTMKANGKYDSMMETIRTRLNPSLARDEFGGFALGGRGGL